MSEAKHFRSAAAYRRYTAFVKMHGLSKRKGSHTVTIAGHKHKVKHGGKRGR